MKGFISQITGPVVDVDFQDYLPKINEAIEVKFDFEGQARKLVLETAAHLGDNRVRTIAMDMTDGLVRGQEAIALGSPITVPVGEEVLGRIFNVTGDVIDEGEEGNFKNRFMLFRLMMKDNPSVNTFLLEVFSFLRIFLRFLVNFESYCQFLSFFLQEF